MKKVLFTVIAFASFTLLSSCDDNTEEAKQPIQVNHENSIVASIEQDNREKYTVITSVDSIYKNGAYIGRIVHSDTIPSLGEVTETFDTEEIIQDADGNDVYKTTQVTHQKAYELYINVAKK